MQLDIFNNSNDKKTKHFNVWSIFTDGASRNNPGLSGAGVYIKKGEDTFLKSAYFLGTKTNNEAEYLALVLGLLEIKKVAQKGDVIKVFADSQLLINQLKGEYKIKKEHLKKLNQVVHSLLSDFDYVLEHVYRDQNKVADNLSNEAIDKRVKIEEPLLSELQNYEIDL